MSRDIFKSNHSSRKKLQVIKFRIRLIWEMIVTKYGGLKFEEIGYDLKKVFEYENKLSRHRSDFHHH